VQWKGRIPAGRVDDRPVIQLDILPTALAAAGVAARPEWKLDGVNLLPFLSGEKSGAPHEALYWRFGQQIAVRKGDWKLVKGAGSPGVAGGANSSRSALACMRSARGLSLGVAMPQWLSCTDRPTLAMPARCKVSITRTTVS